MTVPSTQLGPAQSDPILGTDTMQPCYGTNHPGSIVVRNLASSCSPSDPRDHTATIVTEAFALL